MYIPDLQQIFRVPRFAVEVIGLIFQTLLILKDTLLKIICGIFRTHLVALTILVSCQALIIVTKSLVTMMLNLSL